MQRELLKLLADGQQHSGSDLAAALGVTRTAIWKQVQLLRELGIPVAAQAGQGYSLPAFLELLDRDVIASALPAELRAVIDKLQVLWVTESTSDLLLQQGRTDSGSARICLAEYQTGGRGRRGRKWFAAVGSGICLSVGWCFPAAPVSLSCLGLAIGIAVLRAAQACGVHNAKLKWPNDLVAEDKKLAGILVDVQGEAGGPLQVVAGVGLNYAPDFAGAKAVIAAGGLRPVSLTELSDTASVGRNKVAAELIASIIEVLQQFERTGFESLADEWRSADYLRNKVVQVAAGDRETVGVARGISSDGQLLVESNGQLNKLVSGDVSVRAAL
jgi:BirA family transcriptional regulator, biotin operon repressor / biotin---[acetyl-CoA-carboxylase] ligase